MKIDIDIRIECKVNLKKLGMTKSQFSDKLADGGDTSFLLKELKKNKIKIKEKEIIDWEWGPFIKEEI